jgi:protein required for attachment to host cells
MKIESGTWVLVLDGAKALILENQGDARAPNLRLVRKDENDAKDSRGESTTGPSHAGEEPKRPDAHEFHATTESGFAEEMAAWLYKAAHRGRFERLVLVAPPKALGALRAKLHKEVAAKVVGEIPKTLTSHPVDQIERALADEAA